MSPSASEGRQGKQSDLRLRLISGLVLAALILGITLIGGFVFRLFAIVLAALVLNEWIAMRSALDRASRAITWTAFTLAMVALIAGLSPLHAFSLLGLAVCAVLLWGALSGRGVWNGFGVAYAGLPAIALAFMRDSGGDDIPGLSAILFLFAVVWATDVVAYFVGRSIGGPRLAPSISPGKTWSGAVGGTVGAVFAGGAVAWFADTQYSLFWFCTIAALLSIVSQLGDLFESMLKRRNQVKDSGTLIPGHGGVMDRVDGLAAAAIVFYILAASLSGTDMPAAGFFSR